MVEEIEISEEEIMEKKTPSEEEASKTPTEKTDKSDKPDKAEESKDLQSALAQKKHWRDKAEKAEAQLKQFQEEKPKKSAPKEGNDEWKEKVDFLLQSQGKKYSEDEFEHVANVASRKKISLSDAAKSEDEYIQFQREKVGKDKQIPAPSSPSSVRTKGKTYEDIKDMPEKDFKKMVEADNKRDFIVGGRGV